ncbi:P-loop containing nucleoside triphosphate hydrolase protein, partial [Coniochaeta ligniaria NRRL 30616]
DVVKGKGKGLIILLHGAPGVGKTSTAECVAANAGRPLFPITCGDLGAETAQEVEANLEGFFDLARKWNCVLLLDEADVFLSARVEGNIRHNSLVSVFLRVLEYYSGILVLTTNRVGSFDEAIKSRVHCALYYPPLDKDKTLQVWKMNLDSLEARNAALDRHQRVAFDRREIEQYASENWRSGKRANRWNGRQIKNAFQTAVALA